MGQGQAWCKAEDGLCAEEAAAASLVMRRCFEGEDEEAQKKKDPFRDETVAAAPTPAVESMNALVSEQFQMHTVSVRTFMSLAKMESFGQLRSRGLLAPTLMEAVVHFISHEWLGFTHPDPNGEQLRRMQAVFREVIEGRAMDLFDPEDWKAYSERVSSGSRGYFRQLEACVNRLTAPELTEEDFRRHVAEGEVWLDYASIPQLPDCTDRAKLEESMGRAVRSIPAYLERCQYFWVLTPTAQHVDKGTWCSFTTWRSRGWCRLEEWGNLLSNSYCAPLVVTHAPKLRTIGQNDFILACQGKPVMAPCCGAFTCCQRNHEKVTLSGVKRRIPCDKEFIIPVLMQMLENKMGAIQNDCKFSYFILYTFVMPLLLSGVKSALPAPADEEKESISSFLRRVSLESVTELVEPAFTVWTFAARLGHIPMLRKLQADPEALAFFRKVHSDEGLLSMTAMGGNVEVVQVLMDMGLIGADTVDASGGTMRITALDRAAKYGFPHMVSFLLERRASVDKTRADGSTPLHGAAEAGYECCCRVLLEHRADANAVDALGRSPLHLAADPVTFYGIGEGKPGVLQVLLEHRANMCLKDANGRTALEIAQAGLFHEGLEVFLSSTLNA